MITDFSCLGTPMNSAAVGLLINIISLFATCLGRTGDSVFGRTRWGVWNSEVLSSKHTKMFLSWVFRVCFIDDSLPRDFDESSNYAWQNVCYCVLYSTNRNTRNPWLNDVVVPKSSNNIKLPNKIFRHTVLNGVILETRLSTKTTFIGLPENQTGIPSYVKSDRVWSFKTRAHNSTKTKDETQEWSYLNSYSS